MYTSSVAANVYKCEDEKGKVKFTDIPCSGKSETYNMKSIDASKDHVKKYAGFNEEKYFNLSKDERDKICAAMKLSYEEVRSKKCLHTLFIATGKTSCVAGDTLKLKIKRSKEDYEFACQI